MSALEKLKRIADAEAKEAADPRINDKLATKESLAIADGLYESEERGRAETERIRQQNEDSKSNRTLRNDYARLVYRYLVWYSVFVAFIILVAGFSLGGFYLSEAVLSFLVGSTAAAAIGLVFAVTNGLFNGVGKP